MLGAHQAIVEGGRLERLEVERDGLGGQPLLRRLRRERGSSRARWRATAVSTWPAVIAASAIATAGSADSSPASARLAAKIASSAHLPAST